MDASNELTDRRALDRHRARARPDSLFLQEAAADEVQDRLMLVNRRFSDIAIVTPFPGSWQKNWPESRIVADGDTLDLTPGSFDLVIHGLSLHWSNDPVGQLIQCRRALRPDGLMIAASLGGRTLEELRHVLAEAEAAETGGLSPRVAPMAEIRDLGGLLQRAGFNLPVADSIALAASYRDMHHLMHDLRAMGETNALASRHRAWPRRALFDRAAARYADAFPAEDGRIRATFELVFLAGWAPDDSQPKPLRPGSARMRLAEALAVPERQLPD